MTVAAQLLGTETAKYEDLQAMADTGDQAAVVTLAMVLAAFEWNTVRGSWRAGGSPYRRPYFEFLASCGYRLSPIEQVMADHISVEQLMLTPDDTARLDRIRLLRDQQHQLRMNRYYRNALSEEQYQAVIGSIHAELSALGEDPGPTLDTKAGRRRSRRLVTWGPRVALAQWIRWRPGNRSKPRSNVRMRSIPLACIVAA